MRVGEIHRSPLLPPVVLGLAFWPVWQWYVKRLSIPSDDAWGVVALLTAVAFMLWRKPSEEETRPALVPAGALLILYIVSYPFVPPLVRAAIAVTAVGVTLASWRLGRPFHFGSWGLLMLSLPIIPALQFYIGYPLRVITAQIAASLLRLNGFAVRPEGTCLDWNGELIWVDAPCSGVKMLWTGMFLTMALSCFHGLGTLRTLMAISLTLLATVVANGVRTATLFYIEAKVVSVPAWAHEWAGLAVFVATAFLIFWYTIRLRGADSCEPSLSF